MENMRRFLNKIRYIIGNGFFKNITKDFFLNILASIFSTGVMQLVVYPCMAQSLSSLDYGTMLTVMGYVNVITLALGNNLCNARLVQQVKYNEKGYIGDFQFLVILMSFISIISIGLCCLAMKVSIGVTMGVTVATVATLVKSYYMVTYRIEVNYIKNLLANIFIGVGYIIGVVILIKFLKWPWVFLFGCLMGLLYIYTSSSIIKEPLKKTPLFWDSFRVTMTLAIGGLVSNATTYLDRFMIYPILGGESVSIYATAAFFAKSLNLLLAPITSVLLSYLTSKRIILNKKKFITLNIAMAVMGGIFWMLTVSFGCLITGILYPTLIGNAYKYIPYVSLGIIVGIVGAFSSVVVLACAPIKWQTILPIIKIIIYFILGYKLISTNGLMGLCFAVIITNMCMFIATFVVGFIAVNNNKGDKDGKVSN